MIERVSCLTAAEPLRFLRRAGGHMRDHSAELGDGPRYPISFSSAVALQKRR